MSEIESKMDALSSALGASVRAFIDLEDALDVGVVTPSRDALLTELEFWRTEARECDELRNARDALQAQVKDLTEARDAALTTVKDLTSSVCELTAARDVALSKVEKLSEAWSLEARDCDELQAQVQDLTRRLETSEVQASAHALERDGWKDAEKKACEERDEALVRVQELSCDYGRLKVLEKKAAFERDKALAKVKDLTEARDEALVRVENLTEARDAALLNVINLTTERDSAVRGRDLWKRDCEALAAKIDRFKRNLGDL